MRLRVPMNQKLIREIGRSQRLDILTVLKRDGGKSVKELAVQFGMSYMGIKQHCLALEREGYLDTWRRPKPVGRPEMLYRLTKRGKTLFPEVRNPLTIEILEAVQQAYGTAAPTKILFGIFNQRAEAYRVRLTATDLRGRAAEFTDLRASDGYMSQFGDCGYGPDHNPTLLKPCIVERHSPIEDVLRRYPIIARLEKELFERVLNCRVEREEDSKPGVYQCTFFLG